MAVAVVVAVSLLRLLYMMKSLDRDWELLVLLPHRGWLSADAGLVADYLFPATLLRLWLFVADLLFVADSAAAADLRTPGPSSTSSLLPLRPALPAGPPLLSPRAHPHGVPA